MRNDNYFYNCSKEYIDSIHTGLYTEISDVISSLPKRQNQAAINNDLFWLFTEKGWAFDTLGGTSEKPPEDLHIPDFNKALAIRNRHRDLCLSATTIDASWHTDFGKVTPSGLVQIQAQFGKVELMFKDFCGFRLASYEKRLALGIEIVMSKPNAYFLHRKASISGMAYFDIAKKTLPAIGIDCPIWLVGIHE
jgi:hypothetical protein